ncbi:hypothetical protein PISMIDRAFT_10734 [Pisolithus microcarpus 441]|uniref:Uncharacterized protein n=1 Tax=Pisolithus microcarpus 441 TaxID=765257 RepID=A0A0C9YFU7_9AGAM|nr:hypothetical protein PISMIDRAFT_10734 [Pisolithus microcarpus 441]
MLAGLASMGNLPVPSNPVLCIDDGPTTTVNRSIHTLIDLPTFNILQTDPLSPSTSSSPTHTPPILECNELDEHLCSPVPAAGNTLVSVPLGSPLVDLAHLDKARTSVHVDSHMEWYTAEGHACIKALIAGKTPVKNQASTSGTPATVKPNPGMKHSARPKKRVRVEASLLSPSASGSNKVPHLTVSTPPSSSSDPSINFTLVLCSILVAAVKALDQSLQDQGASEKVFVHSSSKVPELRHKHL